MLGKEFILMEKQHLKIHIENYSSVQIMNFQSIHSM